MRSTLLKKLHQCNQTSHFNSLNNFNKYLDIDKINSQLKRADIKKTILTKNIHREYEIYLNLLRDQLYFSVEKGLNELFGYLSIKDNFLKANEFFYLFENILKLF